MPGRGLPEARFRDDAGGVDPGLASALSRFADGVAAGAVDPGAEVELLAALAGVTRLLVPVVAVPASGAGHGAEMALALLVGTDGRRALPVFTSAGALLAWDGDARPVPVEPVRAAAAALAEGADVMAVDVGSPASYVLEGAPLRALAAGSHLRPLYDDPAVGAAAAATLADEPAVRRGYLLPAPELDARLALVVGDELTPAQLTLLATRVGRRLQQAEPVRAAIVRGVDVVLLGDDRPRRHPVYVRPLPAGP